MEGCEISCSFYGCKRTFKSQEKLNLHLQAHRKNTAQSLPGKVFLCSHIGCQGSFNNMQQLMEHMRHHHKPNIFYLCESCRAKLRSYRTLLKHLQTCAKVAKNKAMKMELGIPADSDGVPFTSAEIENSGLVAPEMPEMKSVPSVQTNPSVDDMPVLQRFALNNNFTDPMPSSGILPFGNLSQGIDDNLPGQAPYSTYQTPTVNSAFTSDPGLQQQRSPRPGPPSLPSSPPLPLSPGSNAVWRKNQAQAFNCRILWEHTRGRYSCLQCVYYTPDRGEMTAHIEEAHKYPNGKMNNDLETESGTPPLLPKLSQYSENSTYTQL